MSHAGKDKSSSVPSDSQAREKLALYVYEYLCHIGATKTAQTFLGEIRWEKNIALGDPPGYLMSWWCVFWDLYCAAPEKRDSNEHSSEAKAFHDYFPPDGVPSTTAHGPPPPPSFFHPGGPGQPSPMSAQPPPPPMASHPHPHPHQGHQHQHPSQIASHQQYMAANRYQRLPMRHQVPLGQHVMPSTMDPSRQPGPHMMMTGQPGLPAGAMQRMPTHADPRIPPQGFLPNMRQPPTVLGLHGQGMSSAMHQNNVWNQQSAMNSHPMRNAGTPVAPSPGPPSTHHPHLPHHHTLIQMPLSTASPSPRTPLEGPTSVGSPYNHGQPFAVGSHDGSSLPLNVGPEHQYPAPMINDGSHNMSTSRDGVSDIQPPSSASAFPPLGPFQNDELRSNHNATDEIRKIKESIGEEAKRFEKVNADDPNDVYPAMP